jgi:hypothetical protein
MTPLQLQNRVVEVIEQLKSQLDELRQIVKLQAQKIEALEDLVRRQRDTTSSATTGPVGLIGETPWKQRVVQQPISRRDFARWGGLAAAGATVAAAATLAAESTPAAAADGSTMLVGEQNNTSSGSGDPTVLYVVGGGTYADGDFTVTDTTFTNFDENFVPGAVTGYAAGADTSASGVSGYSNDDLGYGVFGLSESGTGVNGTSQDGYGVSGVAMGEGGGVSGVAEGGGHGVYASSDSGFALRAEGINGSAIMAVTFGDTPAIQALSAASVSGITGPQGVIIGDSGLPGFAGVLGLSASGSGVSGDSVNGIGVQAQGGLAPLLLTPAGKAGAPTTGTHSQGELYVDSNGVLYLCTAAGTPGTWQQVVTAAVAVTPTVTAISPTSGPTTGGTTVTITGTGFTGPPRSSSGVLRPPASRWSLRLRSRQSPRPRRRRSTAST